MTDCKYYLSRAYGGRDTVGLVEIIKMWPSGGGENITYIRTKDGGFNISKTIFSRTDLDTSGMKELEPIEYEMVSSGVMEGITTIERYLSYFGDSCPVVMDYKGYTEVEAICSVLGISVIPISMSEIPNRLRDLVPWLQEGYLVASRDCISFLESLKKILLEDSSGNSLWLLDGICKLLEKIYGEDNYRKGNQD